MPMARMLEVGSRVMFTGPGERTPAIILEIKYDFFENYPEFKLYLLNDGEVIPHVALEKIAPIPFERLPDPQAHLRHGHLSQALEQPNGGNQQ